MIPRYSRPEMTELWSDDARFAIWLEIELYALEAFVAEGLAPESALKAVKERARFNVQEILEIEKTVKHDVIAFLTNVAQSVGAEARYLHLGMTSSDVLDTAFAVQLVRATDRILAGVDELLAATKSLAMKHRDTICVGRSHGIHAEPTTFGLKVAGWYAELRRQRRRIDDARSEIAVGAISGPVGTYANLGVKVEAHVCQRLGLRPETISTQVIPRDRHAVLFAAYAQLGNSLERICIEIRHLQRTEVREAEENFTKGQKGSSAMPHKRNPILSENVTGLARLLRSWALASMENVALWHERDISHSSVERVIGPDMTITLDFMLARVTSIVSNLVAYPENMKRNLESTHGLIYSSSLLVALLKKGLTREEAYQRIQGHALQTWDDLSSGATKSVKGFPERIRSDKKITDVLSQKELDDVFSLEKHLEHVPAIFERVMNER